jgi:hypothetical protein
MIYNSAKFSFTAQIITGLIDFFALQVNIPVEKKILKELLFLELIVQIIEGIFYFWLLKSFNNVENITKYRYYDWTFSTTLMLFTLMSYLIYLQNKNKTLQEIYTENRKIIHKVLILNLLMLTLGYLGEINKLNTQTSVFSGFIPFILYYKIIFNNFVSDDVLNKKEISKENKKEIKNLFWYFFIFWGLYGIAALLPYSSKNVCYNILDLFSKNFFGLYLSYKVYENRI